MPQAVPPALPLCAAILLAGCAGSGDKYPSLAIRDVERAGYFDAGPATPPEPRQPPSGAVLEQVAQLRTEAAAAHWRFLAAVPGARRLANAAGRAVESDSWAAAQVALADLESKRSQAAVPLGDLDLLFVDATLANVERTAIAAAREEVVALVAEEDAVLADLRGRVRP